MRVLFKNKIIFLKKLVKRLKINNFTLIIFIFFSFKHFLIENINFLFYLLLLYYLFYYVFKAVLMVTLINYLKKTGDQNRINYYSL